VVPANAVEHESGPPEEVVTHNALAKARIVADEMPNQRPDRLVMGVDTVVALAGRIYGKPAGEAEARSHLEALSGREHAVWSALALISESGERCRQARTAVRFRDLDQATIEWYLASGEWRERAGAYAIQGRGAALVEQIVGDYWNVVGLPVALLVEMAPDLLPGH
jgi:septum formation protein